MAKYWVAGSGSWNAAGTGPTGHWAATSGGNGNQIHPTYLDDVIFDANSGDSTTVVSINRTGPTCANFFVEPGFLGTFNVTGKPAYSINVCGSTFLLNNSNSSILNPAIQLIFSTPASTTVEITTNGANTGIVYLSGDTTSTYKFMDDFSTYIDPNQTGYSITLSQGTLNANDKNITTNYFAVPGTGSKIISMGSGTWTLAGGSAGANPLPDIWCQGSGTNVTIDGSRATIQSTRATGSSKYFNLYGATYKKIILGGVSGANGEWRFLGGGTIDQLIATKQAPFNLVLDISNPLTVNQFMVRGDYNNEDQRTLLVNDINNIQTTGIISNWIVPSTSVPPTNYPIPGTIKIDNEVISYASYTAVTGGVEFTGVIRNVHGTAAASHTAGASIYSPYKFSVYSTTSGTRATLNTRTTSGLFRVGNNSEDAGNNLGITFTSGSELDYLAFRDINVVTTQDSRGNMNFNFL